MVDHINLVHGEDEGKLVLVEDGAGVEHVGHEGDGAGAPDRVHHVDHDGGHLGGQGLRDDVPAGRPGEHLDLSRSVDDHELVLLVAHQLQHLVELGGEQVETGDDASVRPQFILFHHLLVVDCVSDVNVCRIRNFSTRGIKINNVGWSSSRIQVTGQSKQSCKYVILLQTFKYLWTNVVFPEPAMPSTMTQHGLPSSFLSSRLREDIGTSVSDTWGSFSATLSGNNTFSAMIDLQNILLII